jgi:hypothetical protein
MLTGVVSGQLYNLGMMACTRVEDISDFVWTVFIPATRIASTLLLCYWGWQEYNVRGLASALCRYRTLLFDHDDSIIACC